MLKGHVNDSDQPAVPIQLILQTKPIRFPAIIDTGFNGYLSVPKELIQRSLWRYAGVEGYELATGEVVEQQIYVGSIIFDGKRLLVYSVTSDSKDILIGTKLLKSKLLTIDFKSRRVTIKTI